MNNPTPATLANSKQPPTPNPSARRKDHSKRPLPTDIKIMTPRELRQHARLQAFIIKRLELNIDALEDELRGLHTAGAPNGEV